MACSIEKESKEMVMLFAGLALVKLLKESPDEKVVSNARAVLASSAEHLEARKILATLLTEGQQMKLVFQASVEQWSTSIYTATSTT